MPKQRKEIIKSGCLKNKEKNPYKKQTIPKAIREQCWIVSFGNFTGGELQIFDENDNIKLYNIKI